MDVLPRQAADAVANMAADLLLLEKYPHPERVRYRPYTWTVPAYTFGVSQKWETYRALVPASTQLVRRATGGGLVSHLEDWTFAVVLPSGHPLCEAEAMASYEAVHQALAEALRTGHLFAAGLDVYTHEPRISPSLLALDNVVLAPHLGSADRHFF